MGVAHDLPFLGRVSTYLTFDNHGGHTIEGGYEKSEFYTKSFIIEKHWLYPFTNQIEFGVQLF